MIICSTDNTSDLARIVIQPDSGSAQVFVFERDSSPFPEWDYLLEDVDEAKAFCFERWGAPLDSWREAPDEPAR